MKRFARNPNRRAVTLIEVMSVVALAAALMASSFVVLRSSYTAWQAHEADLDRAANATAVLRHLVRRVRQASAVTSLSASGDTSGALTVVEPGGTTLHWDHSGTSLTLSVDSGAAQPLADDILQFSLAGYTGDGITTTTDPSNVQAVRAVVTTNQPAGGTRTVSCFTWIRSW